MKKILLSLILLIFSSQVSSRVVEKVVAYVDEEMVSLLGLNQYRRQVKNHLVPTSLLLKAASRNKLLKNKSYLLDFMIQQKVLTLIADEKKIQASSQSQERLFKKLQGSHSLQSFNKKLTQAGVTLAQFKKQIENSIKIDTLLSQEVISKIIVSNNDIDAHHFKKYGKNLFRHFEYEFDSVNFPDTKEGREDARKFIKLLSSSSFKQTAQQRRVKIRTSQLKFSEINASMYKVLKNLSVSQTSSLVPIGNLLYLLHLSWKTPSLSPHEQRKKQKIQAFLFEKTLKTEIKQWVTEQRTKFSIKIHFP